MNEKLNKLISFFRDWSNQSSYLSWMYAKIKPVFASLSLIFTLNIFIAVIGIGSTIVTKYIIDGATGAGAGFTKYGILLLVVIFALSISISAYSGAVTSYIGERYAFGIREKVYENILHGIWKKVNAFHSGDTLTRLTSDIGSVSNGITSIIPNGFVLIIRLLIAFFVLYCYDHFLAISALILGPLGVILSLMFSGKLKVCQTELNQSESKYRAYLQETVENIAIVKTFQQESHCSETLSSLIKERLMIVKKRNRLNMQMNLCINAVFYLGYVLAFSWSIYRLSNHMITYGTMTIFLSLVSQVQGPIMGLGSMIPQFISVLASAGRVMELDGLEAESHGVKTIPDDARHLGIVFQDVSFGYADEMVLQNISFNIQPRDIVGIVGISGIGKTTLANLILQLLQPQNGRIFFYDDNGGVENSSADIRRFISYVPQGNTLISGSIAENILAGNPHASEDEIWKALDIADGQSFVAHLENGLQTLIGENALGLSEGQAQRIAIARAIVRNAPILILDEATSALDIETEKRIIIKLSESGLLHTCIIITHRNTLLTYCTRVIEVKDSNLGLIAKTEYLDYEHISSIFED